MDWTDCPFVERNPERVSGQWVFRGTRLPVKTMFDNLEAGATIDEFVSWFQGVDKTAALRVLHYASESLESA
ncbi:MAG: DUF433 domain-containing protein [Cytophagales bacterium]|nr:DUF433 domain-containing protein [Cytophagales bacterium]